MPTCVKCQKTVGIVGSLLAFNKETQRCRNCEKLIQTELEKFRQSFNYVFQDGVFSQQKLDYLFNLAKESKLDWQEALSYIRSETLWFVERYLTYISADGIITQKEESFFYWIINSFQLPNNLSQPFIERLKYLKYVSNIRQGNLPLYQPNIHLESDEICHYDTASSYHKANLRSIRVINGRFVITNKKIHFLSPDGGWSILWKNVMRVQSDASGIYLELAVKNGNGFYKVPDPLITEATITTITKLSKRQLLIPQTENQNRHIPQDVKNAVWQRDQGKCVQCASNSYLEFDHIIPFSKGGANTVKNVQLLCRNCNLKKSNRI